MDYILPLRTRRVPSLLKVIIAALGIALAGSGLAIPAGIALADSHLPADPTPSPSSSPTPEVSPSVLPEASPSPPPVVSEPPAPVVSEPPPPPPAPPEPQYSSLPSDSGSGRRVVYSNSQQRVWLVEGSGEIAASWLVSGRRGVPRVGVYRVFSKSRYSSARRGRVRMEFMTRFARGRSLAIGFHSIPVDRRGRPIQTEGELGRYRSAGCVRQKWVDAQTMWNWAPIGTAVVVTR